ncbi:hypothetical protein [Streptomyces sp. NRRL S-378]|uniref:hypothetical protein n=1 Tax=Streptomyces sp. NRRL S-378 TaxID=1463904 RepID=UPI000691735D|nr:hypothetical protein [Streptomyces sp. NRRL S-378]
MSSDGAVHTAAGMLGYLALGAALVVLAGSLAGRGHDGWAVASRLVPGAVLAGFAASAALRPGFHSRSGPCACCG